MALRQACLRLGMRRSAMLSFAEQRGVKEGAGISGKTITAPETMEDTMASVKEVFTPSNTADMKEAIGYPGQKTIAAGITGLARLNYGPGRYDYGRPVMPKGWFANYFYGAWEFGHIILVSDKWFLLRQARHIFAIGFFFFPLWLTSYYNVKMHEEGPPWLRNK
eukprot:gnl/MRDRNA2_/MRDRNA2_94455_c0_seq1.p1 gnl/MRDRNA2_/MRDRNA2_94455_c0~~gnl/MRDRNA2_/MRDRNA2_94455_c0_seq1.p1  ORF type:complete len:164 (+),score=24.54 gnl/MRDRNA2_/MRDRNA2_94455_c0_seq1:78-569(+)